MGCGCGGGGSAPGRQTAAAPLLVGRANRENRIVRVLSDDAGIGQAGAIVAVTGDGVDAMISVGHAEQVGPSRSTAKKAVAGDLWYVGPYGFPDEDQARRHMQQTGMPMRKVVPA